MPTFDYTFTVPAPLSAVRDFHHDTGVLKTLTPPPIFVQIHSYEPLGEGSRADFTMWLGPLPLRWKAVHSDVSEDGFTDTQVKGPLKSWRHTHRFTPLSETVTEINEHIQYEHNSGLKGLFSRLFFSKPGLQFLFAARKRITAGSLQRSGWSHG